MKAGVDADPAEGPERMVRGRVVRVGVDGELDPLEWSGAAVDDDPVEE